MRYGLMGLLAVTVWQAGAPTDPRRAATQVSGDTAVLVGAGDIARCGRPGHLATAALLDSIPGTVFTVGDNAYPSGTAQEYRDCYEPSWGRHRARTRPAPGNHEYRDTGAAGYFAYFGSAAGPPDKGYYSYDLGAWHIVVLNTNISFRAGSPQERWLRADLAASPRRCTLAIWHLPRFSSGTKHGGSARTRVLWQALYDAGAELVLVGHEHNYERFAPQTAEGELDRARGVRQFVVGTGGAGTYPLGPAAPNSEVGKDSVFGVLKLILRPDEYEWEFIPVAGADFRDRGTDRCH